MSGEEPISILVLAISDEAAKIVVSAVRKAGYVVQGKVATSKEVFESEIVKRDWDIVFTWERIPETLDIFVTADIVNSHQANTPILIICRSLNEDLRYRALKAGAIDAISLRHPKLLNLVVDRELAQRTALKGQQTVSEVVSMAGAIDTSILSKEDNIWCERIKRAIENDQFFCAYQPIANLNAEPYPYYELLLRMVDKDGHEVSPGAFMGSAEKAGIMASIDRWVIEKGIQALKERINEHQDTCFFIKLSADSINDHKLSAWISVQLFQAKLPNQCIAFEVDAEVVQRYPQVCKSLFKVLRQNHCLLVLDKVKILDETLNEILEQGVDFIKVSGDLINAITSGEHKRKVGEVASTARTFNIKTIAQCVEDASSLSILWQLGINYIQGHYVQRPDTHLDYDFSSDESNIEIEM